MTTAVVRTVGLDGRTVVTRWMIVPKSATSVRKQLYLMILSMIELEREFMETKNKAQSMLSALHIANAWANSGEP